MMARNGPCRLSVLNRTRGPLLSVRNQTNWQADVRAAFTLLELVVGMALLATLLVSVLLATAKHKRLIQLAADRHEAVRLADDLLANWYSSADGVPLNARGLVHNRSGWYWRTMAHTNQVLFGVSAPQVKLEIVRRLPDRPEHVLVGVEVFVRRRLDSVRVGRS